MRKAYKKALALTLILVIASFLFSPVMAIAAQLTSNAIDDVSPQVDSSGKAVWLASDGSDNEVFLWNGSAVVQLTNNSLNEQSPQIANGVTTWIANDGTDDEIYYNSTGAAAGTTQLTNDGGGGLDDDAPVITTNSSGAIVVAWIRNDGTDDEVYTSTNGGTATALTATNTVNESSAQIAGNYAIWVNSNDIYLYNGTSTTQITNTASTTESDSIVDSSGKAAWLADTATTNPEVVYYNATTSTQITANNITESDLGISNGKVVWSARDNADAGDREIYYNGTGTSAGTKKITNNGVDDDDPVISNGRVVWEGNRRSTSNPDQEDYDILMYTSTDSRTYQVNNDNNDQFNPDISGVQVVWQGFLNGDYEIFNGRIRSSSLSLRANPSSIERGSSTTLSGVLKNSAGQGLGGRTVQIKVGSSTVKTVNTNGRGQFSAKLRPLRTHTYKAYFAGSGLNLTKTSKGVKVIVET